MYTLIGLIDIVRLCMQSDRNMSVGYLYTRREYLRLHTYLTVTACGSLLVRRVLCLRMYACAV